jgi:hypothetical protein
MRADMRVISLKNYTERFAASSGRARMRAPDAIPAEGGIGGIGPHGEGIVAEPVRCDCVSGAGEGCADGTQHDRIHAEKKRVLAS